MNKLLRGGDTESSGFVAAHDLTTGKFDGLLLDASGKPLAINGLWALSPGNVSPNPLILARQPYCLTSEDLQRFRTLAARHNHWTASPEENVAIGLMASRRCLKSD